MFYVWLAALINPYLLISLISSLSSLTWHSAPAAVTISPKPADLLVFVDSFAWKIIVLFHVLKKLFITKHSGDLGHFRQFSFTTDARTIDKSVNALWFMRFHVLIVKTFFTSTTFIFTFETFFRLQECFNYTARCVKNFRLTQALFPLTTTTLTYKMEVHASVPIWFSGFGLSFTHVTYQLFFNAFKRCFHFFHRSFHFIHDESRNLKKIKNFFTF